MHPLGSYNSRENKGLATIGKRSNFERKERDFYPTPKEAIIPLLKYLEQKELTYIEPCAGEGDLIGHLCELGGNGLSQASLYECVGMFDIEPQAKDIVKKNALSLTEVDIKDADYIITNPPWTRSILHPLISHFRTLRPTWLLLDAPWGFTRQSSPFLRHCSDIVVVGRLKWIPDSKYTSKDDCCWYKFVDHEVDTIFHSR